MDLSLLRGFLQIARLRNFHEAAEELYMTQSALTKQIKRLEMELGVPLFDRSARQIELTNAGHILLERAPELLERFETICEEVNPGRLRLRIGVLPVMSFYGLVEMLSGFSKEHPQVNLALQETENDDLPKMLSCGEADLIFWRCPNGELPGYHLLTVCEDELALVVERTHPLAKRGTVSLSEAADEQFVFLGKNTQLYRDSLEACRTAGFQPKILYTGSSVESVGQLVRRNGCAALFMRRVALGTEDPELSVLHFEEAPLTRLVLACEKGRPLPPAAQLFWEYAKLALQNRASGS